MHSDFAAQAADLYRAEAERAAREERAARRAQKEARQERAARRAQKEARQERAREEAGARAGGAEHSRTCGREDAG